MQRVMIIGGSGSGKSTVAREIGAHTGLPVVHMDSLFWEPGWVEAEDHVFLDRVEQEVATERWVMDGNYSRTWPARLARADTVIFLDISTPLRLWRAVRRSVVGYGRARPDLAAGCPEQIDLKFLVHWVGRYPWRARPKALTLMAWDGPAGHLTRHHLVGPRAVRRFLDDLTRA